MSNLNSFGSILAHALEMESQIAAWYEAMGESAHAADAEKRRNNLERVRRENVVEIKLEPIDGLDEADYALDLADPSAAGRATVEATAAQFYADVAPKMNVREVQRILEKAGKQHKALADG